MLPVSNLEPSVQNTEPTYCLFACLIAFLFRSITISPGKGIAGPEFSTGSIPSAGSMKLSSQAAELLGGLINEVLHSLST